jgi:hypothetical protein
MVQNIIIDIDDPSIKNRILNIIKTYQGGKCRFCNKYINDGDKIVSCGHGRNYYHLPCAQRLNII